MFFWTTIWRLLKELKTELPYDPVIPLLDIYSKDRKNTILKGLCITVFTVTLFTIDKIWKQPKCPSIDEGIKKMWCIYTIEYYSVINKNEILGFATTWI